MEFPNLIYKLYNSLENWGAVNNDLRWWHFKSRKDCLSLKRKKISKERLRLKGHPVALRDLWLANTLLSSFLLLFFDRSRHRAVHRRGLRKQQTVGHGVPSISAGVLAAVWSTIRLPLQSTVRDVPTEYHRHADRPRRHRQRRRGRLLGVRVDPRGHSVHERFTDGAIRHVSETADR